MNGSGDLILEGKTGSIKIKLAGSWKFGTYHLSTKKRDVAIKGLGNAYLSASDLLEVTIRGSGDVYYKGNPLITSSVSGSGKLISTKKPILLGISAFILNNILLL